MDPVERIRSRIANFAGYDTAPNRRLADEQIRAYVGEALSRMPDGGINALDPAGRELYDGLLLRAEFMNQRAFHPYDRSDPSPERIGRVLEWDSKLLDAVDAGDFAAAAQAFDGRDEAMQHE
jgi:hypothetical protein